MILIVNGMMVGVNSLEVKASINLIARQFSLTDINDTVRWPKGSRVMILSDDNQPIISGTIEHIQAEAHENSTTFTYSGRNDARYLVDGYAIKTTQFKEGEDIIKVFNKILSRFRLTAIGFPAKLPKKSVKKIVVGDKLADQFLEIAKVCGRIITSDAFGNIWVVKKGMMFSPMPQIIGHNLNGRKYTEDNTGVYDKYTVFSQSSRQKSSEKKNSIKGSVGSGKNEKVIVANHPMTEKECKKMAAKEMLKDMQKAFTYEIELKSSYMEINTIYPILDMTLGVIEPMNLQSYTWSKSATNDSYKAIFERLGG